MSLFVFDGIRRSTSPHFWCDYLELRQHRAARERIYSHNYRRRHRATRLDLTNYELETVARACRALAHIDLDRGARPSLLVSLAGRST